MSWPGHIIMLAFLSTACTASVVAAEQGDTLRRHVGFTVFAQPAWQIAMDEYERSWLRGKQAFVAAAELTTAHCRRTAMLSPRTTTTPR